MAHLVDMEYQEEELAMSCSSSEDQWFDEIIGQIEDIVVDDKFQEIQQNFFEKYYTEFDDCEENKLIYTDIHKEYLQEIEGFLETELKDRVGNGFSMDDFGKELSKHDKLDGEIFEMLLTLSDFLAFKEMILDFKATKEGHIVDLTDCLNITSATTLSSGDTVAQCGQVCVVEGGTPGGGENADKAEKDLETQGGADDSPSLPSPRKRMRGQADSDS